MTRAEYILDLFEKVNDDKSKKNDKKETPAQRRKRIALGIGGLAGAGLAATQAVDATRKARDMFR